MSDCLNKVGELRGFSRIGIGSRIKQRNEFGERDCYRLLEE